MPVLLEAGGNLLASSLPMSHLPPAAEAVPAKAINPILSQSEFNFIFIL
jgi:hypothetical protein